MNVLKAAIVGLALISANTLVRADVITDWNNTAMDVMKAVNVAGNPWTRSMALVNVSMCPTRSIRCRTDIRVTCRSFQVTRTPRPRLRPRPLPANSHAPVSRPEGADSCSFRGDDANHSGQPRPGCGY